MSGIIVSVISKSSEVYELSFDKQPGDVATVNLYISLTDVTGSFVLVKPNLPNYTKDPGNSELVRFFLELEEVQALEPEATWSGVNFMSTPLYVRAVPVNAAGDEAYTVDEALSRRLSVVGVSSAPLQDNPASFGFNHVFSTAAKGWVKMTASALGTLNASAVPYLEDNYTIDRTLDGEGNVLTELIYLESDPSGSYAKLITYTAPFSTDGKATKVEYSDSVKP